MKYENFKNDEEKESQFISNVPRSQEYYIAKMKEFADKLPTTGLTPVRKYKRNNPNVQTPYFQNSLNKNTILHRKCFRTTRNLIIDIL